MKTLFHSLLACAFILSTFAANATTVPQTDGLGPKITIIVEIGRKSRDCTRIGICRVNFDRIGGQSGPIGENTATGTAWIESGKLKIEFNRGSMTDATYQTHFGNGNFQLEEDFVLPSDIANALGVRSYTIKTGKYTVPESASENNTVLVSF